MEKPCYASATDYFQARHLNHHIIEVLRRAGRALTLSKAVVSLDSPSFIVEDNSIDLVNEIEELLAKLEDNESS